MAKAPTKSEILTSVADTTELSRKQVASVLDALTALIGKNIGKKGPGIFQVPGLMKITIKNKPATKAGTRPNPFKPGEMMDVKAKPASRQVRIRPLKALKDLAK